VARDQPSHEGELRGPQDQGPERVRHHGAIRPTDPALLTPEV
jgi:hypothetical protein